MIEKTLVILTDGPQGSGKTTATEHLNSRGYIKGRGIPTGEALLRNTTLQNWQASIRILKEAVNAQKPVVLDRSLWSLVAYGMRVHPGTNDFFPRLGCSIYQRLARDKNCLLLMLDAEPQDCCAREDKDGILALGSYQATALEIAVYRRLRVTLELCDVSYKTIMNSGITKDEFCLNLRQIIEH